MDPQGWLLFFAVLSLTIPNGGLGNFFHLILKEYGYNAFETILLGLPTGVVQVLVVVCAGYIARKYDKKRGEQCLSVTKRKNLLTGIPTVYVGIFGVSQAHTWRAVRPGIGLNDNALANRSPGHSSVSPSNTVRPITVLACLVIMSLLASWQLYLSCSHCQQRTSQDSEQRPRIGLSPALLINRYTQFETYYCPGNGLPGLRRR